MGFEQNKKFILLSKIAKEKKYAQEYLGLLARRGDLGSIRIGKRWYTTQEWVEEFRRDSEKKRELPTETVEKQIAPLKAVGVKIAKGDNFSLPVDRAGQIGAEFSEIKKESSILLKEPASFIQNEPLRDKTIPVSISSNRERPIVPRDSDNPSMPAQRQANAYLKIKEYQPPVLNRIQKYNNNIERTDIVRAVPAQRNFSSFHSSNATHAAMEPRKSEKIAGPRKFQSFHDSGRLNIKEKTNNTYESRKELISWKNDHNFSPSFSEEIKTPLFSLPKLAFSFSMVLVLALIVQMGLLFQNDIKRLAGLGAGIVAGAADSREANVSLVKPPASQYLQRQSETIRENISISRVLLKASIERDNKQGIKNKDQ